MVGSEKLKKEKMKKLILLLFIPLVSFSQTFELTNGQSMCMIGKGMGQDATINPYANEEFSYALIENIGTVKFNIRAESIDEERREFIIKPKDIVVVKLYRNNILYFGSLAWLIYTFYYEAYLGKEIEVFASASANYILSDLFIFWFIYITWLAVKNLKKKK